MTLKLRRLSYCRGAEVCDVDIGKPMSDAEFGEIYRAFLDHGILVLRNQRITRSRTSTRKLTERPTRSASCVHATASLEE